MKSEAERKACAVILAGGRGTRFWPRSRLRRPKQLLNIVGPETMLRATVRRLRPIFPWRRIWVVTHAAQRAEIRRQLPQLPPSHILAEPVGRNTAAAIALAALHIRREHGNIPLGVFPADQIMREEKKFLGVVRAALEVATRGENSIVLGVSPRRPETGYGYVQRGALQARVCGQAVYRVRRFTEKPSASRAHAYLASGEYFWNSGMFFWTVETFFSNLARFLPATAAAFERLARAAGTPRYASELSRFYPRLKNISVDYAILERARNVLMLRAAVGWSDLGSWAALYEALAARPGENLSHGKLLSLDARGNLFWVPRKLVAAVGVKDLVVVETDDALLVCRRERSQDVSRVVKELDTRKLHRYL